MDLVNISLYLCFGYASFFATKLDKRFNKVYFYILGSILFELTSICILKINDEAIYFKYVDFLFGFFELTFLYWFIFLSFRFSSIIPKIILVNIFLMVVFLIFQTFNNKDFTSEIFNAFTSTLHIFLILICLYELTLKFPNKGLFKSPVSLILIPFLIAYAMLIIIFFLLQDVISYSRIIANQMLIFKHIISILFYITITYGLKKSLSKN